MDIEAEDSRLVRIELKNQVPKARSARKKVPKARSARKKTVKPSVKASDADKIKSVPNIQDNELAGIGKPDVVQKKTPAGDLKPTDKVSSVVQQPIRAREFMSRTAGAWGTIPHSQMLKQGTFKGSRIANLPDEMTVSGDLEEELSEVDFQFDQSINHPIKVFNQVPNLAQGVLFL